MNKDTDNPKHFSPKVWATRIPALRDRSTILKLPFDPAVILEYTLELASSILTRIKIKDRRSYDRYLSKRQKAEIIRHLADNADRYSEVSPRLVHRLGELRLVHQDDDVWAALRESQLRPSMRERKLLPVAPRDEANEEPRHGSTRPSVAKQVGDVVEGIRDNTIKLKARVRELEARLDANSSEPI